MFDLRLFTVTGLGVITSLVLASSSSAQGSPFGGLKCHFENHGKNGNECWAELNFRPVGSGSELDPDQGLKVRCSKHFYLEDRYPAFAPDRRGFWINGSDDGKLAVIRIKAGDDAPLERYEAELVVANAVVDRIGGHCRPQPLPTSTSRPIPEESVR